MSGFVLNHYQVSSTTKINCLQSVESKKARSPRKIVNRTFLLRVEKYQKRRRKKRRFLSVFVGFIGFACKKCRFVSVLSK